MVAGRESGVGRVGVVLHHVRDPLPAVHVLETRGVRGTDDVVRVTLRTQQIDGFGHGAVPEWEEGTG